MKHRAAWDFLSVFDFRSPQPPAAKSARKDTRIVPYVTSGLLDRAIAHRIVACLLGAILNETRHSPDSDLDKLTRLKALSWLSASELGLLAGALCARRLQTAANNPARRPARIQSPHPVKRHRAHYLPKRRRRAGDDRPAAAGSDS